MFRGRESTEAANKALERFMADEHVSECVLNLLVQVIFSDLCNFQRTNHTMQAFYVSYETVKVKV